MIECTCLFEGVKLSLKAAIELFYWSSQSGMSSATVETPVQFLPTSLIQ